MMGVERMVLGTPVEIFRRGAGGSKWERVAAKFSHYQGAKTVVEWPGGRFEGIDHQDVRPVKTSEEPAE